MSLRRFEADTMPAALAAVRAELGTDAIILSNRRLDGDRIEIIATGVIDEALLALATDGPPTAASANPTATATAPPVAPVPSAAPVAPTQPTLPAPPVPEPSGGIAAGDPQDRLREEEARPEPGLRRSARSVSLAAARAAAPPTAAVDQAPTTPRASGPSASSDASSSVPPPVPTAGWRRSAASRAAATEAGALERVEERLRRLEVGLWGGHDSARALLLSRLLGLGLGATLALRLAERAVGADAETMLQDALAGLVSTLPVVRDRTLERAGATLIAGPDAQSRTDVLMKFAMRQVAADGPRSLVLVSADAERTGAFEALEASGRDLGVATVRARGVADLGRTLDMFRDRALVLVDTGRTLPAAMNEDAGDAAALSVRRLVVLPATLQRRAACRVVREARDGRADGCVLSHLDADARPGEVLDALVRHWLGIAWWSDSDAPDATLKRADAAAIVAGIAAAARRIEPDRDDAALGSLLHPGAPRAGSDFRGPVALDADAAAPRPPPRDAPGRSIDAGL